MAHEMTRVTFFASAARTATANSAIVPVANWGEAVVVLRCTAAGGTTPTLDVKFQITEDGTNFTDMPTGFSFTQLTAAGSQALRINNFGSNLRAVATITGTDPTFTFSLIGEFKDLK